MEAGVSAAGVSATTSGEAIEEARLVGRASADTTSAGVFSTADWPFYFLNLVSHAPQSS